MLRKNSVLLIVLLMLCALAGYAAAKGDLHQKTTKVVATKTDVEIFKAVLAGKTGKADRVSVVINETDKWSADSLSGRLDYYLKEWFPKDSQQRAESRPLLKNLATRNKYIVVIPKFEVEGHKLIFLSNREQNRIFKNGPDGWKVFYRKYPKSDGISSFSLPSYSSDGNTALLTYSHDSNIRSGYGEVIRLKKDNGAWHIEWKEGLWIS